MPFPQFGGTNDVPELDIGQKDSTRFVANDARWIGRVGVGPDEVAAALHRLPAQNVVYRGAMGFTGRKVTWEGSLKLKDDAILAAIEGELNAYRHGGLTTPDPALLKSTKLTNLDERVLSENAVLEDWRFTGRVFPVQGDASFTMLVRMQITFVCLA